MRTLSFLLTVALLSLLTACQHDDLIQPATEQLPSLTTTQGDKHPTPNYIPKAPLLPMMGTVDINVKSSTWTLVNTWNYVGTKPNWDYIHHVNRGQLENNDVRIVVTSLNYQSDVYAYGYTPLRTIKAEGLDPNVAAGVTITLDDLEAQEEFAYFYTYTWTPETEYEVRVYERPRTYKAPVANDYPYANTVSACNSGIGCTADQWDFCQHSAASWAAWKINQTFNNNALLQANQNGISLGDPASWDTNLARLGWLVDQTAQGGTLAQWEANPAFPEGHVAYVHEVSASGDLVITEYNHPNTPCAYSTRVIRPGSRHYPNNFIHVP